MINMPTVLYIGSFQPFHKGHLSVVKYLVGKFGEEKLIIAIAASNKSHEFRNPFTLEERKQMLENCLQKEKIKIGKILEVPDIPDDSSWTEDVKKAVGTHFDIVCTGSDWTASLFKAPDIEIVKPKFYKYNKQIVSASLIRDRIVHGKQWEHLVPEETTHFLKKIKGVDRI